ncbi:MAG: hypothetical protein SH808_14330 [Saprospiraceae bacterium]|nr:hypothetical protein [Saprospiraceae bacterium]
MRFVIFLIFLSCSLSLYGQQQSNPDPLSGQFYATLEGDAVVLGINRKSGSSYIGTMTDRHQKYALTLELSSGTDVSGTAKEYSMGIQFDVAGTLVGDQLSLTFSITVGNEQNQMKIDFTRDGTDTQAPTGNEAQVQTTPNLPKDASHPQDLIGTWIKEDLYNSGYGDNYMGAGFSQSMTFLADGNISEGGSSATMSGSNYSGQSTGQGSGVIPGVKWYTIGNQLYMQVTENGQTQNAHLGKYYIENNNMLITGTNGEKILLKKSN